jgi:hypothetical protein
MSDRRCITGRPELPPQLRTLTCSSASLDINARESAANGFADAGSSLARAAHVRAVHWVRAAELVAMRDASRDSTCDEPSRQIRVCVARASSRSRIAFVHGIRRLALASGLSVARPEQGAEQESRRSARGARARNVAVVPAPAQARVGERSTP